MKKDSIKKNCDKVCAMAMFAAVALVGVNQILIKTHSDNFSNQVLQEENNCPIQRFDFYPSGPSGATPGSGGYDPPLFYVDADDRCSNLISLPFLYCSNKNDCPRDLRDKDLKCKFSGKDVITCSANSTMSIVPSMPNSIAPPKGSLDHDLSLGPPPGVNIQTFTGPVSFKCNPSPNGNIGEWFPKMVEGKPTTYWCTSGL
jgi:hypothetical protein